MHQYRSRQNNDTVHNERNARVGLGPGIFVPRSQNKILVHRESKKLDTFSFEHNFGKYDPILIILSLLQTAINHDKAYHKIYHHTSNLLVYYLVK